MANCTKNIETGADRLMCLVLNRTHLTITQASQELDVEKKTIEDWAHALEDVGMIQIKDNFRDKVLMKPEYKENIPKKISRNIYSLFISSESGREKDVKKQQEQVNLKLLEIEKKLSQLKHMEELKTETNLELRKLEHKKKEIEQMQSKLDESLRNIEKNTIMSNLKEKDIISREEKFKNDAKELVKKFEQLKAHEKLVDQKEKKIHAHLNEVLSTHEKSKIRLIEHLNKMKI